MLGPSPSVQPWLASRAGNEVDQLPGSPDEAKPDEGGADAGLRHLHSALVVANDAEVHEARGSQRDGRDKACEFYGAVEEHRKERRDPSDVHGNLRMSSNHRLFGHRGS